MLHALSEQRQPNLTFGPRLLRELREAITDLKEINPWLGLSRFVVLGSATVALTVLTWQVSRGGERLSLFVLGAIAASIAYSFWLVCNHDATHRTLTGWDWFDGVMPRLISWPMLLPVGTYNQIHRLHHCWNGIDLRDPERAEWTATEYARAPFYQRWYVRHQWVIDLFIFGSFGLIFKTLSRSLVLREQMLDLHNQVILDAIGIICMQGVLLSCFLLNGGNLWAYLLFWLVLERGIGIVMQARDHLEHYGVWQQVGGYQLTQLYACRNVKTFSWVNWLMGGLPYHSVHHAFPHIAINNLPEAFSRIQTVLQRHHLPPMAVVSGYLASSFKVASHPSLITSNLTAGDDDSIPSQSLQSIVLTCK